MLINNQNNQENFYGKISKILNNSAAKFSIAGVGGFVGIGALGLITKLIYDKLNNKNTESEKNKLKTQDKDEIKLDANNKKFITKNFFLCQWGGGTNLCWNDVLIQFLMLPDIRCKEYNSQKIMKTINWINKILGEKYDGDPLDRKIEVPLYVRPVSDGLESYLTDDQIHNDLFFIETNGLDLQMMGILNYYVIIYPFQIESKPFLPYGNCKRYLTIIGDQYHQIEKSWDTNKIFAPKAQDYYPTFIVVYDDVNTAPHYHAYIVIYNKNKEVKYFLWVNDLKNNMKVLSKNNVLKELKKFKQIQVVYSCSDIIEKYYITKS